MSDPTSTTAPPAEVAPAFPPVPRPITPRARRRSWAEMPVRGWMILTLVIALVTGYFTATRVHTALLDRWLIAHGTNVTARVMSLEGGTVPKRAPRNQSMSIVMRFTLNGQEVTISDRLPPKAGAYLGAGDNFPIKVDPANPQRWTEETQFKPWSQELTVAWLLVPLLVVLVIGTLLRWRGVLRTWRHGSLVAADVIEVRHTAAAPMSRVVRFTLRDGADRRVSSLLMPTSAGIPVPGQTLWLLCPPNKPNRAIAAKLYV